MKTNRRKFIINSSLTFIGFGISNSVLGNIVSFSSTDTLSETIAQKLQRAANKRRNGNFNQAKNIYNDVIAIDSNEIRAYDGIRKILLQNKFKELEVLQLYLTGLNNNPTNAVFKERVAKEYMRLALGNKKFVTQLNNPQDLLVVAKQYFDQAKTADPLNLQFEKQFEKSKRKINQSATTIDARANVALKNERKTNRKEFKNRYTNHTELQLNNKLTVSLAKPQNEFRKKSIREIYRVYIKKLRKNGNIDLAVQNSLALYEFDKSDTRSLRIARSITRRYSKFEVLENIERQNEAFKHNFWSKIGLFDVLLKRYKKEGIGNLTEMNTILLNSVPLQITPYHSFEIKTRQVKLSFAQNNTTEAKNLLDSFADSLMGISSANFIDRYTILCVKYYKKINDDQKALIALNIALKQNNIPLTDSFLQKIEEINKNKDYKKSIHNERLNNFRIKLINNLEG